MEIRRVSAKQERKSKKCSHSWEFQNRSGTKSKFRPMGFELRGCTQLISTTFYRFANHFQRRFLGLRRFGLVHSPKFFLFSSFDLFSIESSLSLDPSNSKSWWVYEKSPSMDSLDWFEHVTNLIWFKEINLFLLWICWIVGRIDGWTSIINYFYFTIFIFNNIYKLYIVWETLF